MSNIITVPIPPDIRKKIISDSESRGRLNNGTLVNGEGNIGGFAGEAIVQLYLPFLKPSSNLKKELYNFDFKLPNGKKIDVKSKGNCKFAPEVNYDCTVPADQRHQQTDFYVFTRISRDLDVGWICGVISKKRFYEIASLRKEGEAYNNNGRKSVHDHYCCLIKDLDSINIIKDYYEINSNI